MTGKSFSHSIQQLLAQSVLTYMPMGA